MEGRGGEEGREEGGKGKGGRIERGSGGMGRRKREVEKEEKGRESRSKEMLPCGWG